MKEIIRLSYTHVISGNRVFGYNPDTSSGGNYLEEYLKKNSSGCLTWTLLLFFITTLPITGWNQQKFLTLYWDFNQSNNSCALNTFYKNPADAKVDGSYSYTDGCSSVSSGTTCYPANGNAIVTISSSGYALRNTVNSSVWKNYIFHISGSELTLCKSLKVCFQNKVNISDNNSNLKISCSRDGITYTQNQTFSPNSNWSNHTIALSTEFDNQSELFLKIEVRNVSGSTLHMHDIDNFQVQGFVCNIPATNAITINGRVSENTLVYYNNCGNNAGGIPIGLYTSEKNVLYQLYRDGIKLNTNPIAGTGASISFGYQTLPGVYTATGISEQGGCSANINGSARIALIELPVVRIIYLQKEYCSNISSLTDNPSVIYQFSDHSTNSSTGGVFSSSQGLDISPSTGAIATNKSTPGTYTVVYTGSYDGCTITGSATVAVKAGPATPSFIVRPLSVKPNRSGYIYKILPVNNADSYEWKVPVGWSITSGGTGTSITVASGATGGQISVAAKNSCGLSKPCTLNITFSGNK